MPSRSASYVATTVQELPIVKYFLPSMISHLDNGTEYTYHIYLGYDDDDGLYNNAENRRYLHSLVNDLTYGRDNIGFSTHESKGTQSNPVAVWNMLAGIAYRDNCEYFYQINDDIEFLTSGWEKEMISVLQNNKFIPNFGLVAPGDVTNMRTMTQTMVHRTHLDIFGTYYPTVFKNWYSDDWTSNVYNDHGVWLKEKVKVKNINPGKRPRYRPAWEGKHFINQALKEGCQSIQSWIENTHKMPGDSFQCDSKVHWWDVAQKP